MPNQITRLLRRRPEIDAAEFELLQARVVARLKRRGPDSEGADAPAASTTTELEAALQLEAGDLELSDEAIDALARDGRFTSNGVTVYALPANAVAVMASPDDTAADTATAYALPANAVGVMAQPKGKKNGGKATAGRGSTRKPSKGATTTAPGTTAVKPTPQALGQKAPPSPVAGLETSALTTAPPVGAAKSSFPASAAPYCPYCALRLDPPPTVGRRCPRCRERIAVRRVDGRIVYLTEASVAVYEAERRRARSSGRWTRERRRWLKAAASAGAPVGRIDRIARAPISDDAVAAARALYVTTVDFAVRTAKRERRWEDASLFLRDHAMVLFRMAGSPIPPPEEILEPHRDSAAAALRGIQDLARAAELVSVKCCTACRADHGKIFRIAEELRTPRLPHAGCPKGLCRCDWYLAVNDQALVLWHMRRRARANASVSRRDA